MIKYIYIFLLLILFSCKEEYGAPDAGLQAEFADVQVDSSLTFAEHRPREIKYLFVHAIATDPKQGRWSAERLKVFFRTERNWDRYGYHEYIDQEGRVWTLTPLDGDKKLQWEELTYNASGYNNISIAISLEGGCEYKKGKLLPKDNFTAAQIAKIEERIIFYKKQVPGIVVLPHNAVNKNKACPAFDITKLKI